VQSYCYPYHHEGEIEKQVDEMMQQGIIRHNSSAFSSPVILVKKDVAWRLCVDYRELNKVTCRISIQFSLLKSCWMSYMEQLISQNWI